MIAFGAAAVRESKEEHPLARSVLAGKPSSAKSWGRHSHLDSPLDGETIVASGEPSSSVFESARLFVQEQPRESRTSWRYDPIWIFISS